MNYQKTEIAYLRRRISASLAMAVEAVEPCARISKRKLATPYGKAIDQLTAQPVSPI